MIVCFGWNHSWYSGGSKQMLPMWCQRTVPDNFATSWALCIYIAIPSHCYRLLQIRREVVSIDRRPLLFSNLSDLRETYILLILVHTSHQSIQRAINLLHSGYLRSCLVTGALYILWTHFRNFSSHGMWSWTLKCGPASSSTEWTTSSRNYSSASRWTFNRDSNASNLISNKSDGSEPKRTRGRPPNLKNDLDFGSMQMSNKGNHKLQNLCFSLPLNNRLSIVSR